MLDKTGLLFNRPQGGIFFQFLDPNCEVKQAVSKVAMSGPYIREVYTYYCTSESHPKSPPDPGEFLKSIMTDALEDYQSTTSKVGRVVDNLRFADEIDGLAGSQNELAELIKRLDSGCTVASLLQIPTL